MGTVKEMDVEATKDNSVFNGNIVLGPMEPPISQCTARMDLSIDKPDDVFVTIYGCVVFSRAELKDLDKLFDRLRETAAQPDF